MAKSLQNLSQIRLMSPSEQAIYVESLKNADHEKMYAQLAAYDMSKELNRHMAEANRHMRNGLDEMFVYCLTETADNLLMWSHYTESHSVAAVRFNFPPKGDNMFSAASKVIYQDHPPSLGSREEWMRLLDGDVNAIDSSELLRNILLTKSSHWKYEDEWRLIVPLQDHRGQPDAYFNLRPEDIGAIYLGCKMPESLKQEIIFICRKNYPKTEVYQGKKSFGSFALSFHRLE